MIAPNVVLTAAHNIYNNSKKIEASLIEFIVECNGNEYKDSSKCKRVYYPKAYKDGDDYEDYGLLILESNLGETYGYIGICNEEKINSEVEYNVYGYPADKVRNKHKCFELWGMKGKGLKIQGGSRDVIEYNTIDTYGGQSGSPIYYIEEGFCYVVGVHVSGGGLVNEGTYLNKSRFTQIQKWMIDSGIQGIAEEECNVSEIKELVLNKKNLSDYAIKYLSFFSLPELNKLVLSENNISENSGKFFSKMHYPKLQELYLNRNSLLDKGVEFFSICKFENLTKLILSRNGITAEGMKHICNARFPNLVQLNLDENKIGEEGMKVFMESNNFTNLEFIVLENCELKDKGVEYFLRSNIPKIATIFLENNQITEKGFEKFKENENKFSNLKTFRMNKNQIRDKGLEFIANTFLPKLQFLEICENEIGIQGAIILFTSLKQRELTDIYLNRNKIGEGNPDDFTSLSKTNLMFLKNLYLANNYIQDNFLVEFSKGNLPKLQNLQLNENFISDLGVVSLCSSKFTLLQKLDLSKNSIGDSSCDAICTSSFKNTISKINLGKNNFSDEGKKKIQSVYIHYKASFY